VAGVLYVLLNMRRLIIPIGIIVAFVVCMAFFQQLSTIDMYPMGSGRYETSPNGKFVAHANNMQNKHNGETLQYYEFEIEDAQSNSMIKSHRIFLPKDTSPSVHFRSGNGKIIWNEDSSMVSFGSDDELIWHYKLTL
jgi:hypothetical protein